MRTRRANHKLNHFICRADPAEGDVKGLETRFVHLLTKGSAGVADHDRLEPAVGGTSLEVVATQTSLESPVTTTDSTP